MNAKTKHHADTIHSLASAVTKTADVAKITKSAGPVIMMMNTVVNSVNRLPWGSDEEFQDIVTKAESIKDEASQSGFSVWVDMESLNLSKDLLDLGRELSN